MRGMLIKDWYLLRHYCKSVLLVAAVFIGVSLANRGNVFFLFVLCVLMGMLPMTLLAYDERSRWDAYSQTLPASPGLAVSEKYLLGLSLSTGMAVILWIAQWAMFGSGISVACFSLTGSLIPAAIILPFAFRFGTERARYIYYLVIGVMAAFGAVILSQGQAARIPSLAVDASLEWLALPVLAAALGLYLLSWLLAVVWYRKREF